MSKKNLRVFGSLVLVLKNEPIWEGHSQDLTEAFSLISQASVKKTFVDYLMSPFLVRNPEPVLSLLNYLYPKLKSKQVENIRIKDVLWVVYGSRDFAADKRKLKALLKRTCEEIYNFRAYLHLEDKPEELARLQTLSLRNKGVSTKYQAKQTEWEELAQSLPAGTHGAFHRWAAKDAGYIGLDIPKSKFDPEDFKGVWCSLSAFTGLQQGLYELEIARNKTLRAQLPALTEKGQTVGAESRLTKVYKDLTALLSGGKTELTEYRNIKRRFFYEGEDFDVEQRLAIMIGLLNYLQDLHVKGDTSLQPEMYFWPYLLLKSRSYEMISVIPKRFYNNQLHRALINDQMWLAKRIKEKLSGKLPVDVRDYVQEHNEVAFAFHDGQHEEVVAFMQKKFISRFHEDNHDEIIRLKTYYLRSLLVLLAERPKDETLHIHLKQALKTLDKYLIKYDKLKILGWEGRSSRYRRFRTVVRNIFIFLKDRPYKGTGSLPKIRAYIDEDLPLVCRKWLQEFTESLS